jgi:hypothetical protein
VRLRAFVTRSRASRMAGVSGVGSL